MLVELSKEQHEQCARAVDNMSLSVILGRNSLLEIGLLILTKHFDSMENNT